MPSFPIRLLAAALVCLALVNALPAQTTADQAADMLLNSARVAYNQKNYPFAAERFKEFLAKYGQHKEVPSARYGLALCLVEGSAKDYAGAADQLQQIAGDKDLPDHPFVLYYLGLSQRGLGVKALAQAAAKPNEAAQHMAEADKRFDEAAKQYGAATSAFAARVKEVSPDAKELPVDLEWAARSRCDLAEMQLRLSKAKDARETVKLLVEDKEWTKSRYRPLGLYYHGFASFQLKDNNAAGRSLSQLTPFTDPAFGTHARYLLARVHHQEGERQEAMGHYDGLIAEYLKQKAQAPEILRDPARYKNDPNEKARLEALIRDPAPEHVQRAGFYLGVLQYEDGKFGEAVGRLAAFAKDNPKSPLVPEAQLRVGFCQVQLKQFAQAQQTLVPLADKEPRLADQCLFWIAKARVGEAGDPATNKQYTDKIKTAFEAFRAAVERNGQLKNDPDAPTRRGEILLEFGDALQAAQQYKDATGAYNQILSEKLIPAHEEEVVQHLATALHLGGEYAESDKVCAGFVQKFPKSTLLPAVLFRHAENAYFMALAAEKIQKPSDRATETAKWTEEAIKRYTVVVEKYPEFAYASVARYGLGMAYFKKGDFDKAKELLAAIPATDRTGDLAAVPLQIADILIRTAPEKADDAISAGKLEEAMKGAIEQLDGYVGANPNVPQTADAFVKLGHCHTRLAGLIAQPQEQQKEYAAARRAYEQVMGRFQKHELFPQAVFERAKVIALQKDINGAMNELRRFTADPLKNAAIAPMAQLHLATLLRGQNKPQDAAALLAQTRQTYEAALQSDPNRAAWVPLLRYHHGVALREAGKPADARAVFEQVVKQSPDRPEALEAALRYGQCLKDEGQTKLNDGTKRLANPGLKPEEQAAAKKLIDDGNKEIRDAAQYLITQSAQLKEKHPDAPSRARMLYDAAWAYRVIADQEVTAAHNKMIEEQWQKLKDEVAQRTPKGRRPLFVPKPDVPLAAVPVQPAEKDVRAQYKALIDGFPDLAVNADARFELAELLSERGEQDEAIKLLRSAIDKEPPPELTDKVRVRLGNCLLAKGDTKAALNQFNAVTQNPKSAMYAQAMYRAGECAMQSGDHDEAVKRFAIFRDQPPYQNLAGLTDRALLRLGHALEKQKQWEPSRRAHELLVQRFPQSPWALDARYGMGWAHQNQNQFDQAIAQYTPVANGVATELGARAQLNIGVCKLAQKKYAEASSALLVVPFTFDYPQLSALALVEAARAFAENNQKDEAIKLLESVLRDYPDTESAEAAKKRLAELKKG
jgi:TolA-binding protein